MQLPEELRIAIERDTAFLSHGDLARAVAKLGGAYKLRNNGGAVIDSPAKLGAYLEVRMPATFAANWRVFQEIAKLMPGWQPRSVLDLGAGPGTATWAALEVFLAIENVTLVERDRRTLEAGKRIAAGSDALRNAIWRQSELTESDGQNSDLVVISYALGELTTQQQETAIGSAWFRAKNLLAIVGPGTPDDFRIMLAARTQLIAAGAHILAPCPHEHVCPMADGKDWCHFAQRLERSSDHRRLKAGVLGYEDEKFSYLIASRNQLEKVPARIVRHPRKHGGHVQLNLCSDAGLVQITVSKSQRESYRRARHAEWGQGWDSDSRGQ